MLEVTVTVEAPGYMAQAVKESIGAAAELYGWARITSVREIASGPRMESQCAIEALARFPWEGAQGRKRKKRKG